MQATNRPALACAEPGSRCCSQPITRRVHAPSLADRMQATKRALRRWRETGTVCAVHGAGHTPWLGRYGKSINTTAIVDANIHGDNYLLECKYLHRTSFFFKELQEICHNFYYKKKFKEIQITSNPHPTEAFTIPI
jgi:hypothetical protein